MSNTVFSAQATKTRLARHYILVNNMQDRKLKQLKQYKHLNNNDLHYFHRTFKRCHLRQEWTDSRCNSGDKQM